MRALMVQGVSSSCGKSLITTALARALRRRGVDVVPFKAQNMSNNARVVEGGEIGTAQYLQALAALIEPSVLMNPVLIKPEGDNRSQVVVLGKPDHQLSRMGWRERGPLLWPVIERSLKKLLETHALVLIEGAGSPAETNLRSTDLANMRTAEFAGARVVMVADIDRGGAFAHLYGTWAMLPLEERARFVGFMLNKFRGDPALLPPAPEDLEHLTGVKTIGVIPWLDHGLPDEDGAAVPRRGSGKQRVSVVRYPTASNLDEFKLLEQAVDLRWVGRPEDIERSDLVVLPGSKNVTGDLDWLVRTGVAEAVLRHARSGASVLGICGGLQMLGERIGDEGGVDGSADGLGLLPLRTLFKTSKLAARGTWRFKSISGPWRLLSGRSFSGYQIRHGSTQATASVDEALSEQLGYVSGSVLAIQAHGLFEDPSVIAALFGALPARDIEATLDQLGEAIEEHMDVSYLLHEAGVV